MYDRIRANASKSIIDTMTFSYLGKMVSRGLLCRRYGNRSERGYYVSIKYIYTPLKCGDWSSFKVFSKNGDAKCHTMKAPASEKKVKKNPSICDNCVYKIQGSKK